MTLLGCRTHGPGSLRGLARATQPAQPLSSRHSLPGLEGRKKCCPGVRGSGNEGGRSPGGPGFKPGSPALQLCGLGQITSPINAVFSASKVGVTVTTDRPG